MRTDFAFVEYYDARDADDAIKDYDGYKLEGSRCVVEKEGMLCRCSFWLDHFVCETSCGVR